MLNSLSRLIAILNWGIKTRLNSVLVEKTVSNLAVLKVFLRAGLIKSFKIQQKNIKVFYKFSGFSWHNRIHKIDFVTSKSRIVSKSIKAMDYESRRVWGDYLMSTSLGLLMYSELLQCSKTTSVSGIILLKIHYSGGIPGTNFL